MSVSPVTTSAPQSGSNSLNGMSADELSQQFLKMMVAQMQNQDPTNPMNNNEMVSQLAQFNMASGIASLNQTVAGATNSLVTMNASDWVGRSIMIEGDPSVSVPSGATNKTKSESSTQSTFGVANPDKVDNLTITLTGKDGTVYTQTIKDVDGGVHRYDLGDKDFRSKFTPPLPEDADTAQENGPYKVKFSALNDSGDAPTVVALKSATVQSVTLVNGTAQFDLGIDGKAGLNQIYAVK
ncbi:flagellar hook assembly protein FlgD [Erwinia sp. HR93]|uniref:flagellar hook assembly protein FlgD n=1 Tax=Erwinia sp. HR93 TaxID=3094840 RepID=UPI002ADEE73B|nr:flagellar hook capping FlgD N-terminal domain-containing protein [Erwinia sp. HR93]MEA1062435.1 flagellar hook capping FlgD N-terminal domain-containing protein [Erwinia sp. HR93]